jgi:hypothetical protein
MSTETEVIALQVDVVDRVLLTVLQGITVVGFLGISALASHLLVRAFRAENGEFRIRDAKIMLAGASVLFVIGFTGLVSADGTPTESLAAVALGFTGVTYLLYTTCPELFERADRGETSGSVDDTGN